MTTQDFITQLFCRIDDKMKNVKKHCQASLHPSELVTLRQPVKLSTTPAASPVPAGKIEAQWGVNVCMRNGSDMLFGSESETQLRHITDRTSGRIFDGKDGLAKAFREAKGYN